MPKIKNIIIFVSIGVAFVLIYFFFIKPSSTPAPDLTSSNPGSAASAGGVSATGGVVATNSSVAQDFLSLLLSVKSIKLDDSVFAGNVFNSLRDSSIVLTPDGTEGRPNPFAPIGIDIVVTPSTSPTSPATPTTPIAPTSPVAPTAPVKRVAPTAPTVPIQTTR